MPYSARQDIYFCELQGREYLDALVDKISIYRNHINNTNMLDRWSKSIGYFFGMSPDGKISWEVTPGGEFGEVVQHKVNDYSSLIRHELVLAIQNRPAGIAKAINMDSETLRNARIGSQLVEYYLTDPAHNFEADYVKALMLSLLTSEAFIVQDWNTSMGPELRPDEEGKPIRMGDLIQTVFPTWLVARDIGAPNPQALNWYIFSSRVNKFELAAKYPAYREEILSNAVSHTRALKRMPFSTTMNQSDFIEIHRLIHFPSDACVQGRMTLFLENHIIEDTPYIYNNKNVHRCESGEAFETPFAHTPNYDLLSLEQVTDSLTSIATNAMATFGSPIIIGPKGGGVAHQELGKAGHYLEVDLAHIDKIRALDLGKLPEALMPIIQYMNSKKGELSGINSILRGDPQGQLKGASGSAMALLQSQAITYNSANQASFYKLLSSCGTGIIEMMRQFSPEPRIAKIAGKNNSVAIKEFKFDANTLNAVSTVIFEPINPVMQTAGGKLTVAQDLLQGGMVKDPNEYIEVLTTGNLSVITNKANVLKEAIIEENEKLMQGEYIQAVISENHLNHISEHQLIIAMPEAKKDPVIIQNALEHINQHLTLWQQASAMQPALLIATGQQVLPVNAPPQPMQAPVPSADQMTPDSAGPDLTGAPQPNLPAPPIDPGTGEPAPVAPGTDVR